MMRQASTKTKSDQSDHVVILRWSAVSHIRHGFDHLDHLDHPLKLSSTKKDKGYVSLYVITHLYRLARKRWSRWSETHKAKPSNGYSRPGVVVQGGHSDRHTWSEKSKLPIPTHKITKKCRNDITK